MSIPATTAPSAKTRSAQPSSSLRVLHILYTEQSTTSLLFNSTSVSSFITLCICALFALATFINSSTLLSPSLLPSTSLLTRCSLFIVAGRLAALFHVERVHALLTIACGETGRKAEGKSGRKSLRVSSLGIQGWPVVTFNSYLQSCLKL